MLKGYPCASKNLSWEWERVEPLLFVRITQILSLDHFPTREIQELTVHLLPMLMRNTHRGKKIVFWIYFIFFYSSRYVQCCLMASLHYRTKACHHAHIERQFLVFRQKVLVCTLHNRSLTRCVSFKIIVLLDITFSQKLTHIVTWEFIYDNMPTNNRDEGLVVAVGKKIWKIWMRLGETVWLLFFSFIFSSGSRFPLPGPPVAPFQFLAISLAVS